METERENNVTQETAGTAPLATETQAEVPTVAPVSIGQTPELSFFKKNKTIILAVCLAIVVLVGAGAYYWYSQKTDKGTVVALVGNTAIYEKDYLESARLIEQNATAQGADLADEAVKTEIKNQALDILINNALLLAAASQAGITSTEEDVQKKYDELATQLGGPEVLATEMAKVGLTEEKLRSNIRERVLADKYIESTTDIEVVSVSDEEIADFVKTVTAGGQTLPPLEQVRPEIEAQLLGQKQQQIVTELLAKLRSETKVETKI